MRLPGLAQMNVHIDEAGCDRCSARIETFGFRSVEMFAERSDDTVA